MPHFIDVKASRQALNLTMKKTEKTFYFILFFLHGAYILEEEREPVSISNIRRHEEKCSQSRAREWWGAGGHGEGLGRPPLGEGF